MHDEFFNLTRARFFAGFVGFADGVIYAVRYMAKCYSSLVVLIIVRCSLRPRVLGRFNEAEASLPRMPILRIAG